MKQRIAGSSSSGRPPARAVAVVATIVLLLILDLIMVGIVLGLSRDHDLTVRRMQSIEAMYAAEAGMNMAIRELMVDRDEDGDTYTGGISHDLNDATDPYLGNARFVVIYSHDVVAGETTLTAEGRRGDARRKARAVLKDP